MKQKITDGLLAAYVAFDQFRTDKKGATAIEYGLIAALVAVVLITALTTLGDNLSNSFNNVAAKL